MALEDLFPLVRSSSGSITHSAKIRPNTRLERVIFVANWIETHLSIVTKDKLVTLIAFNRFQWILLQYFAFCAMNNLAVQVIVPKGRQGGVSTFVQAWNFALAVLNDRVGRSFRATTIAHVEESSLEIFRMSRHFERKLDNGWAVELETRQKGMLEWPSAGAKIQVATVKADDALGKGGTLQSIHGSECANWADEGADPSQAWTSIMNALADSPDSMVVLESTPKGRDPFFFRAIDDALNHRNTFRVIFLPWYFCPDYVKDWKEYRRERLALGWDEKLLPEKFQIREDEQALVDEVAGQIVKPGEEWHRHPAKLTEQQLVWRRHTIEKKCEAKIEVFQRYYPSTLEECWTATAKLLVSPETVEHYYSQSLDPKRGEVVVDGKIARFVERGDGQVWVWKEPQPGRHYVIGADVSDGSDRGDGQCAYVVDKDSLECVAAINAHLESDLYAALLCRVGRWYHKALLGIENNYDPSCAKAARELGYPNLYYYRDLEGVTGALGRTPKAGWNTNRRTRTLMLAALAGAARDREWLCYDKEWALELGTFSWAENKKRFQAQHGKRDDRIVASAIAVYLTGKRDAIGRRVNAGTPVVESGSPAYRAFMADQERVEERNGPIFL